MHDKTMHDKTIVLCSRLHALIMLVSGLFSLDTSDVFLPLIVMSLVKTGLKGAMPPIFSVTLKSQKKYSYQWNPKNKGPVLFKVI